MGQRGFENESTEWVVNSEGVFEGSGGTVSQKERVQNDSKWDGMKNTKTNNRAYLKMYGEKVSAALPIK